MTFNTGNNVPSTDPRDLYDNAENLDKLVNGVDPFYADRKGILRESWAGMENSFNNAQEGRETAFTLSQADKEGRFQAFLVSSGYVSKGDYAANVVLAERNQYVAVDAATTGTSPGLYRPNASASLPLTLTGTWATDSASLVLLGDDVLRQELASDTGTGLIGWLLSATGAVSRWLRDKLSEQVSILDFMTAEQIEDYKNTTGGVLDHTAPMLAAIAYLKGKGGGVLLLPAGTLRATRLPIESGITWRGEYGGTYILCIDSSTLDAGVSHGSFIRKADNGARVVRPGFENLYIGSALSGVAAAQDTFAAVMGINLAGCERSSLRNLMLVGFGMGGIVLARCEGGTEGLGFTNTVQDGNYNTGYNIAFASCGKYNPDKASIWFKYKANSNKFHGIFGKPASTLIVFQHANDNLISGCAAESSETLAYFGSMAAGNVIQSARAEALSSHLYDFHTDARSNAVFGGYYTGVSGNFTNNLENTVGNSVIDGQTIHLGAGDFPPSSGFSTNHNQRVATFRAVNGDNEKPLHIKSPKYSDPATYPTIKLWDSKTNLTAGQFVGRIEASNLDTTGGAAGVSAALGFVAEDSAGGTAIVFETGTGSTRSEKARLKANGDFVTGLNPSASALATNNTMVFELVSNTQLRVRVRGSDGVSRSATLTLA